MKSFDFFQNSAIESINNGKLKEYFFTRVEDYLNKLSAEDLKEIVPESEIQFKLSNSEEIIDFSKVEYNINEKLMIINQGKNCKEFILQSAVLFIDQYYEYIFEQNDMSLKNFWIPVDKVADFYEFCYHSRIEWKYDIQQKRIKYTFGEKKKRQLSVKSTGSYYTPKIFSDFMAQSSILQISKKKISDLKSILREIEKKMNKTPANKEIISDIKNNTQKMKDILPIRVIDLTVGTGNFLRSALDPLIQYLKEARSLFVEFFTSKSVMNFRDFYEEKCTESNTLHEISDYINKFSEMFSYDLNESQFNQFIGHYIIENCLYGLDLDEKAVIVSKMLLKLEIYEKLELEPIKINPKSFEIKNILCRNAITSSVFPRNNETFMDGIKKFNGIIWSDTFPDVFPSSSHLSNELLSNKTEKREYIGFDLVIGNPPWEILKPNDREFFRNYIKDFQNHSRKKQDSIKKSVLNQNPEILKLYDNYIHDITDQIGFINNYNLFNYQSAIINGKKETGDPQLYKLVLETAFSITKSSGGIISYLIQHNLLGSKGCTGLRRLLLSNGDFEGIWEFYNKSDGIIVFPNIDLKQRFIIIQYRKNEPISPIKTTSIASTTGSIANSIVESITTRPDSIVNYKRCMKITDLNNTFECFQKNSKKFYEEFSGEELQLFTFGSEAERKAFLKLLSFPKVSDGLLWGKERISVKFGQDLHVTRDRHEIVTKRELENLKELQQKFRCIPVFGGKNIGPYYVNNNRSNIHDSDIKYLKVSENNELEYNNGVRKRILQEDLDPQLMEDDCLVCRNILPNSAKRLIFSIIPNDVLINNSCTRICIRKNLKDRIKDEKYEKLNRDLNDNEDIILFLLSIFNSLTIEFYVKTFLTGINLNYYILDRIPVFDYGSMHDKGKFEIIQKRINQIIKNTKFLISNPPNTTKWILKYEKTEANLAMLFELNRDEFSAILDTFNFEKLNKTTFSGIKPFYSLDKEKILSFYED